MAGTSIIGFWRSRAYLVQIVKSVTFSRGWFGFFWNGIFRLLLCFQCFQRFIPNRFNQIKRLQCMRSA